MLTCRYGYLSRPDRIGPNAYGSVLRRGQEYFRYPSDSRSAGEFHLFHLLHFALLVNANSSHTLLIAISFHGQPCFVRRVLIAHGQETQGVCVATYGPKPDFPAFYTPSSGVKVCRRPVWSSHIG
jgi:hypothetical protein